MLESAQEEAEVMGAPLAAPRETVVPRQGFGVWVSGFGFSGFEFRVSSFRVSNFGFRVSGFGFRVSSFGFRLRTRMFSFSDFGSQLHLLRPHARQSLHIRVSGFGFRRHAQCVCA